MVWRVARLVYYPMYGFAEANQASLGGAGPKWNNDKDLRSLAWPLQLRHASLARLGSLTPPATSAKHGKVDIARLRWRSLIC